MREILFRGKRVDNGEWETGSLVYARMGTSEEQAGIADKMTAYHTPVIPETVGQYTGLTDKNGKKIFEGDIVKISNDEIFEVKYEDGGFTAGLFLGDWDYGHVEVIGNIYDNPELMEVEEHE